MVRLKMRPLCIVAVVMSGFCGNAMWGAETIRVDCDFPGGNIVVVGIVGDRVQVRQDLRDTAGWWFYWYFRVRGAEGRTVRFELTDGEPVGMRGPAVSTDGGATWKWQGAGRKDNRAFVWQFAPDAGEVRFAFTIPYLQTDWERFLARHKERPQLRPDVLCTSRRGRPVECLYVRRPDREPPHRVLLTARHHACESIASFAVEGLLDAVLASETDEARWLAENVEFLVVPFVDKDGVENGDQGKNRRPRDHNRDYAGESVHLETAAIRRIVPDWSRGKLHAAIDIHCPWIRGNRNEEIYLVGSSDPHVWTEQKRFGETLERARKGPLPYLAADNLPFGVDWNTEANYQQGRSMTRWAAELAGMRLATSIELPYANVRGVEVTPERARAFGSDVATALARYLQTK